MRTREYRNPPIREAVFDVRFTPSTSESVSTLLEKVREQIQDRYPIREEVHSQSVTLAFEKGHAPTMNTGNGAQEGIRLISQDKKQILRITNDGFTFSWLEPYPKWEVFSAEAEKLLKVYLKVLEPRSCTRLALRYINAIKIPSSNFELSDYFKTEPKISAELPQDLMHFFLSATLKDEKSDTFARINQTPARTGEQGSATVLFDIDVFQPNLNVTPNSKDFYSRFEIIKKMKTRIFEGSITDKTRSLFK